MKKLTSLMMATALTASVAAPAFADGHAQKWDMPMAYSASNFHSENGVKFADCVRAGTDGAIDITVHPGGSLFKGADIKRAIQTGQVPIGERLLSGHQNENAVFGFDSVPFLATSFDASAKLFDAAKPKLEEILADQNLTLLYSVPWPPQGLYFKKEVNSVADMEGVKFRSYNNATARLAELTGMLPVTIEAAEISQAFATGVAESMISSGATGYDRKVWESLTHFYEVDAWLPYNHVMVNSDVWADVSDENRSAVMACAETAAAEGLAASKAYTQFTLDGLKEGGMTVGRAGDGLVAELKEVGVTMTNEWLDAAGDDGKSIVDAFNN
jgi:TRAP-type C4-dicarboxylate transport system substrate-binding protein